MIKITVSIITIMIGFFLITACGLSPSGMGGGVWIDQPLDGAILPMAPVTIQAHASDSGGVAKIEFFVADSLINSVAVGGKRLEGASIEWNPPNPASYTLHARAIDNQGNTLVYIATIQIMVSNAPLPKKTLTNTFTVITHPTLTSLPQRKTPLPTTYATKSNPTSTVSVSTPTITLTQNANCRSGPSTNYPVIGFLMQGQTATIEGRNAENNWYWILLPSKNSHCWVSMIAGILKGNLQGLQIVVAPPLNTATATMVPKITTPPITIVPTFAIIETLTPIDNTPPSITNVVINPNSISKQGCGKQDTLIVSATVTDSGSGVGNVTYEIRGPGPMDAGDGYLQPGGGNLYQATIGPIAGSAGVWTIWLHSSDMANNTADAGPWTFNVLCIQ